MRNKISFSFFFISSTNSKGFRKPIYRESEFSPQTEWKGTADRKKQSGTWNRYETIPRPD